MGSLRFFAVPFNYRFIGISFQHNSTLDNSFLHCLFFKFSAYMKYDLGNFHVNAVSFCIMKLYLTSFSPWTQMIINELNPKCLTIHCECFRKSTSFNWYSLRKFPRWPRLISMEWRKNALHGLMTKIFWSYYCMLCFSKIYLCLLVQALRCRTESTILICYI